MTGSTRGREPAVIYLIVGIAYLAFSLLARGTFNPFALLAFIFLSIFHAAFRKQKRLLSSLLSIGCSLALVLSLKGCVIDFVVMKSDVWEPRIPKNARILYRPRFFKLSVGDLVIYKLASGRRKYVGEIRGFAGTNICEIYRPDSTEAARVPRRFIKGKVVKVVHPGL